MRYLMLTLLAMLTAACGNAVQPATNAPVNNTGSQTEKPNGKEEPSVTTTAVYEFKITGMH